MAIIIKNTHKVKNDKSNDDDKINKNEYNTMIDHSTVVVK